MPSVIIFTELLESTGLGHLARCTALYDAFVMLKETPLLVLHTDGTSAAPNGHYNVIEFNWKDSSRLITFLGKQERGISVVDSYLADAPVYEAIASHSAKLACLDDTNRLPYPKGSIILNPGIRGEALPYDRKSCQLFAGGAFALLRPPFQQLPETRKISESIANILITTGGEDKKKATLVLARAARECFPLARLVLIIGPGFHNVSQIAEFVDANTILVRNPDAAEMRTRMLMADLALTAGGQTLYELAVCGLPAIAFKAADNQSENIVGFAEAGSVWNIGDPADPEFKRQLSTALQALAISSNRKQMSIAASNTVDRLGARNAAQMMRVHETSLRFRRALPEDLELYFHWANDPVVRKWSYQQNQITLAEHTAWFTSKLADRDSVLLVFSDQEGHPVGQVRIEHKTGQSSAVIGISVDSGQRGRGYATKMIAMASAYFIVISRVRAIRAYVHRENQSSINCFCRAGFKFQTEELISRIPSVILLLEKEE